MKNTLFLLLTILFFSCINSDKTESVLTIGIITTDMNIRLNPEVIGKKDNENNNILYEESVPGSKVEILDFLEEPTGSGLYWCKVKTKSTVNKNGKAYNSGWMVYKHRELPYVISEDAWHLMKKTLGMEYKDESHYLAKKDNKPYLLQAVFDFSYSSNLVDIKEEYDALHKNEFGKVEPGPTWYNKNTKPRYSIKFSTSTKYSKACRARISTPSKEGDDEEGNRVDSEYFVVFEQNPQKIQIFHQNIKTLKGEHVSAKDLSYLGDDIKSISRIKRKSRVYTNQYDYNTSEYKTRLRLNFDAVKVRTYSDNYHILYNTGTYTNYNLTNLYLSTVPQYRRR